jgi:hypothetical protein
MWRFPSIKVRLPLLSAIFGRSIIRTVSFFIEPAFGGMDQIGDFPVSKNLD